MDYIDRVSGMKPTKSCLCCRTMTVVMEWPAKQFLITSILFDCQIIMVQWNIGTPDSQN